MRIGQLRLSDACVLQSSARRCPKTALAEGLCILCRYLQHDDRQRELDEQVRGRPAVSAPAKLYSSCLLHLLRMFQHPLRSFLAAQAGRAADHAMAPYPERVNSREPRYRPATDLSKKAAAADLHKPKPILDHHAPRAWVQGRAAAHGPGPGGGQGPCSGAYGHGQGLAHGRSTAGTSCACCRSGCPAPDHTEQDTSDATDMSAGGCVLMLLGITNRSRQGS